MVYILLSILFFTGIFLVFKIIGKKDLSVINIIVINYFVAALLGNVQSQVNPIQALHEDWLYMSIIIGLLYFIFFIVIGISTKLVGLSVTTVASKMSVVIPIVFSIIYFNESLSIFKISGIILALTGVILTVYKKPEKNRKVKLSEFLIPLLLFIGMGVTDMLTKIAQDKYLNPNNIALFNSSLFYIAFLISLIYVLGLRKQKEFFKQSTLFYGIILGTVNYYGVYFFLKALDSKIFDSSVIFGINNVSIVILSVFLGFVIFKEKTNKINIIGIASAITAIVFLSIS